LAARIGAFEARLCYAKITPAALHRGDCKDRCVDDVEAVGRGLEFQSGDFSRNRHWRAAACGKTASMASS
jgi:hypothetical protein